jgi:hypothetical protein
MKSTLPTLDARTYRWTDRLTKLLGVGLIGAGIHVGGATPSGLVLGVAGVAIGTATVFLNHDQ